MKFAQIHHDRCNEPDGTTYGFVPNDWTKEDLSKAAWNAKRAYEQATAEYVEACKQTGVSHLPDRWWIGQSTPDYARYPDKTVAEVQEIHQKEIERQKREKAILMEARKTFGQFLKDEGFIPLFQAEADLETMVDWGHQHGMPLEYGDTWPGDLDKQGVAKPEED